MASLNDQAAADFAGLILSTSDFGQLVTWENAQRVQASIAVLFSSAFDVVEMFGEQVADNDIMAITDPSNAVAVGDHLILDADNVYDVQIVKATGPWLVLVLKRSE